MGDLPAELKSKGKLPYWEAPTPGKREVKPPERLDGSPLTMSTQRSRAGRGGPRGNGQEAGEETALWAASQDDIHKIVRLITRAEACKGEIFETEERFKNGSSKPSVAEMDALSALHREQVRLMEEITQISDGGDHSLLQKLSLLKAVVGHNEVSATTDLPRRGTSSREARERSTADFDGAADSPAPSPIVDKPTRKDRSAGTSRSSLPPKDTVPPIKQESLEAPGPSASAGAETNAKGKVTFAMGADVAFRLKQAPKPGENKSDLPEWIQGVVVKIIGEGKSRRYDVQDPAPDEVTNKPGQVYRTSASSMVPIPLSGAGLPDYPPGKVVLARYPDTTTFYRADVVGMNGGMVVLKFEDDEGEIREVERRLVLDHRY